MSWFKSETPYRKNLSKKKFESDENVKLEAFKLRWTNALDIIKKQGENGTPDPSDVTEVLDHVDHMITLLLQETKQRVQAQQGSESILEVDIMGPLLFYLLSEGVLDRLYNWSLCCGPYLYPLQIEQLKIFEVLVTYSPQNLFHEPVIRPLLRLLSTCTDQAPVDVEKRLIVLLNSLCVCLSQCPDLLQVFFDVATESNDSRFLIFTLLVPFVHREGPIGQQARDALLLCMTISRKYGNIGVHIAAKSDFCPVLATGLSGLYSVLPRKLDIVAKDWCRFSQDDIQELPELAQFLNSLEFCNAVVQAAHVHIQEQLLCFLHQGFLEPVLGPALAALAQEDDLVASTAYLELFIRTVSEPRLLHAFLRLLLTGSCEDSRILDTLIVRLASPGRLGLVSMALFHTLLDLNCEDVMIELVFKYLGSCSHIMLSQRSRLGESDVYSSTAERFLSFIPACCLVDDNPSSRSNSVAMGGSVRLKRRRTPSTSSFAYGDFDRSPSFYSGTFEQSFKATSYLEYMRSAHEAVIRCSIACMNWSGKYDGQDPLPDSKQMNHVNNEEEKGTSFCIQETFETNDVDEQFWEELNSSNTTPPSLSGGSDDSILDQYEFPCTSADSGVGGCGNTLTPILALTPDCQNTETTPDSLSASSSWENKPADIGPFLNVLLARLEMLMHNDVYLNLQLTALLARLALYPQPLLRSFLLNHTLVFQPTVRSLLQVLGSLKLKIDSFACSHPNFLELQNKAKRFLTARETTRGITKRSYSIDGGSREPRRLSLVNLLWGRGVKKPVLEPINDGQGYRFIPKHGGSPEDEDEEKTTNAVLSAVVLEEFLKELSAIAQEHALVQEDPEFWACMY